MHTVAGAIGVLPGEVPEADGLGGVGRSEVALDPGHFFLEQAQTGVGGESAVLSSLTFSGEGALASVFHVTDLAAATLGAAGLALAELVAEKTGRRPAVAIDRRLASFWFENSLRPIGWSMPPAWDAIAGDYRASDAWIRLHTNAPHHRDAAVAVLKTPIDRKAVEAAVAQWSVDALETAIVAAGGCAAAMRSLDQWNAHPQGRAVAEEPLVAHTRFEASGDRTGWSPTPSRPLQGLRILDLTRILAGPVATRFLAGYGAEVLRIDPPGWEEPITVPEVVLGKRCARLDLKTPEDRATLERLLTGADVFVHGYRPEALARLGLGPDRRRALNPGLIDVCLDAYGWTGPWRHRRGFDSLMQMSVGIADAGMTRLGRDRPTPLPVQAIDHATGYLMAAAILRALKDRMRTGDGAEARASLARTAQLLISGGFQAQSMEPLSPEQPDDLSNQVEATGWGPARRIRPPLTIEGAPMVWAFPAPLLGSSPAAWSAETSSGAE